MLGKKTNSFTETFPEKIMGRFILILTCLVIISIMPNSAFASLVGDTIDIDWDGYEEYYDIEVIDPGVEVTDVHSFAVLEIDVSASSFTFVIKHLSNSTRWNDTFILSKLDWFGYEEDALLITGVTLTTPATSNGLTVSDLDFTDGPGIESGLIEFFVSGTSDNGIDTSSSWTFEITGDLPPPVENEPPVADAGGLYSGIVGSPVDLDGSDSYDPDGDYPLTFSWSVSSSTPCTFDDAASPDPQLTCVAAGEHTVTLTVIDDGIASDSDATTVTTITPQGAIADLIEKIEMLVDDGVLKPGQANGLIRPLVNAVRSLDKGNVADACNQLADFIDEVYAKAPSPLDATTAAELIADADAIRDAIGCII